MQKKKKNGMGRKKNPRKLLKTLKKYSRNNWVELRKKRDYSSKTNIISKRVSEEESEMPLLLDLRVREHRMVMIRFENHS